LWGAHTGLGNGVRRWWLAQSTGPVEPHRCIDDWAMAQFLDPERRDFWAICEDRYGVRSTVLRSQLPVSPWHEQIGDPTLADAFSIAGSQHYRIEMSGGSMRKNRLKPKAQNTGQNAAAGSAL
jgi:hypothetical protein